MKAFVLGLFLLSFTSLAVAGTEMRLWHSYTHQPSGNIHYSFSVANYKRGLFWGSCGPSTRSLKWMYWVDVAGAGPSYSPANITVRNDADLALGAQPPISGEIKMDAKRKRVEIQLKVQDRGTLRDFEGNGSYLINEKP
jgi:hypothetical protein